MNLHGSSFIGARLSQGTGETFLAVSPLNNQPLDPGFFRADGDDVEGAMRAAEAAFAVFARSSGELRALLLETIASELEGLGDELVHRAHLETGLPKARLTGELARTAAQLRLFAQTAREGSWVDARIDTAIPGRKPAPKPDLRRMLIPIGPVVVFGSSNFPLAFSVAGGDTASALATGNPVVVKAHSGHPGTSELVAGAVRQAVNTCGLPEGVFSMLQGSGKVIGTALVRHPCARAVGFTGSRVAGRALFNVAAARPEPIPVFAEMSSLNPVFVLPGAMRERGAQIAEGLRGSITLGVGQFCTKPGLIFAVAGDSTASANAFAGSQPSSEVFQSFEQSLARAMEAVSPATMLHSGICNSYYAGLDKACALPGTTVLARSKTSVDPGQTQGEAVLVRTTAANYCSTPALAEEVFGPFGVLVSAGSIAELEHIANGLEGQLTATVHASEADMKDAATLLAILERKAGRLIINGFPTGVEVCPAMNHGGPYPATTDVRFTSVGTAALYRFVRPVCYQDVPAALLPDALKDGNPLGIIRTVNGKMEMPQPLEQAAS